MVVSLYELHHALLHLGLLFINKPLPLFPLSLNAALHRMDCLLTLANTEVSLVMLSLPYHGPGSDTEPVLVPDRPSIQVGQALRGS